MGILKGERVMLWIMDILKKDMGMFMGKKIGIKHKINILGNRHM